MIASGRVFRSDLVGTGRAISILFGINGVRKQRSHLVGPPFPEFKACFSATQVGISQAERTETGVRLRVVESENDLEKKKT